jgi:Hydantoinase/oxoprolinase
LQVIGFDMGGTSTDVSRYDGTFEHVLESTTAGVTIQAPQLDINTVAAGGGSRLFFRSGVFAVGPESAGAHPGPVCYRKRGHLAVTDANLALGRVVPEHFPKIFGPKEDEALDRAGAAAASIHSFSRGMLISLQKAYCHSVITMCLPNAQRVPGRLATAIASHKQHLCTMMPKGAFTYGTSPSALQQQRQLVHLLGVQARARLWKS